MKDETIYTIGIDVGGTKIASGLVGFPNGSTSARHVIPTAAERGGKAVLDDVERLVQKLIEATPKHCQVQSIGLGLCELVDPAGRILSANCIQWQDQPVVERLAGFAPVSIEADVRAAALAEALFGAGRSFRIFVYVTVGTGISSCLMINGEPFLGAHGATGTMASSPLTLSCEKCGEVTGRTLEEIASGPALVARYNQRGGAAQSATAVLAAAASGDVTALEIVRSAGEALGSSIGLLVNVLDPEAVVIGGGLGLSEGLYWESLVASTRAHIWSEAHRDLPVLRAATGPMAGVVGAAAAAWKRAKQSRA